MLFLLVNWKALLSATGGFVLGCVVAWPIAHHAGAVAGKQAILAEQAQAAANNERERVKDDAALRNLSDRALCMRALGSRGLPNDCDGL